MKEKTEFYCHNCEGYIIVELDMSLNGNHVINCPKCDHEHCRVIQDGKITGDRWDSRNQTYHLTTTMSNWSMTSMASTSSSNNIYLMDAWSSSNLTTTGSTKYW